MTKKKNDREKAFWLTTCDGYDGNSCISLHLLDMMVMMDMMVIAMKDRDNMKSTVN